MEICTTQRKIEVVFTKTPFLLLTGIPLFLPLAAFISAKILAWRTSSKSSSISPPSPPSSTAQEKQKEEETSLNDSTQISTTKLIEIDEEAAEDFYRRKIELELQFILYQGQKDRETRLLQVNNKLFLEKTRLEFLAKEVGLMNEEAQIMGQTVMGYLKLVKEIKSLRWVNGVSRMKVKKLSSRLKSKSRIVREQRMVLKARDEEMERSRMEMDGKDGIVQELRSEIGLLRSAVNQLEHEKIELLNKTESMASALSAKDDEIREEFVSKEDNDYVVKELLRVEEELRNVGWENTRLRSDLARLKQEKKSDDHHPEQPEEETMTEEHHHQRERVHSSSEVGNNSRRRQVKHLSSWLAQSPRPNDHNNDNASSSGSEIMSSGSEITVPDHHHESKRHRFMNRIKGLVDGKKSEHDKEKHGKLRSVTAHYSPPRNSFSSV